MDGICVINSAGIILAGEEMRLHAMFCMRMVLCDGWQSDTGSAPAADNLQTCALAPHHPVNRACYTMLGYNKGELESKNVSILM